MGFLNDIASKLLQSKGQSQGDDLPQIESISDQTPDEKKLVEHIRSKIDQVRQSNSRIAIEGIYLTNVAYLLGFDGVYYDTTYRQFKNIDPKRKLSRNRFKTNKILPTIQNRLSRICQTPPKYDVRPNSNSSEDKDCARLGLDILTDVFDKQNFIEKRQDLHMTGMQGGVAYAQAIWDPMLGNPMFDPETNGITGYEGDVRIDVLNCLEVFPDPLAKNLDDAQWIIKAKVRKLDYFRERYPDRGDAVKEENVWLLSSLYDLKSNALTSVGIAGAGTNEQMKNSAIELVYYEKRSKEYPNGRMIVSGSGVLLEDKELPIGEFDIIKFDDILIGGRYGSEAVITHLRPIQDQYNITRTRMANLVRAHLGGKYLVAKGSGLSQEAINNGDTEVVEYNPVPNAGMPQPMAIPQMPQYAYEEIKALDEEFDFVSGINEATRGVAPSASMPFRGMALLVEQDQTRIAVQTSRNEVGYAKLGSIILKYVGKNYQMPRMLKTAGDGLGYAVKEFMGQDLNSNYDVVVIPGSSLPASKVLKRQDILNAFETGLLGDPSDPKLRAKVLKMLEYGDVAEMWKEQALDEMAVKRTIDSIVDGSIDLKNPGHEWDNHQFFMKEMNTYRKTDKYEDLDTYKKGVFNYVLEWHLNAATTLANPQIPQQQMMAEHMVNTMNQMKAQNGGQLPRPPMQVQSPGQGAPGEPPMPMQPGGLPQGPPMAQGA